MTKLEALLQNPENIIPMKFTGIIKHTKKILNLDSSTYVTAQHVITVSALLQSHLDNDMSPEQIRQLYDIQHSNFNMGLKSFPGVTTKTSAENGQRLCRIHEATTDISARKLYAKRCQFKFDSYLMPKVPGYDKLLELGMFHATKNPGGVCRDHMMSIEFGFRNNIPHDMLSHPANCQLITNHENITKGTGSILTEAELHNRIEHGQYNLVENTGKQLPKTEAHKQKIAETLRSKHWINNGISSKYVLKSLDIPDGWFKGKLKGVYNSGKKRKPLTEEQRKNKSEQVKAMWASGRRKR